MYLPANRHQQHQQQFTKPGFFRTKQTLKAFLTKEQTQKAIYAPKFHPSLYTH